MYNRNMDPVKLKVLAWLGMFILALILVVLWTEWSTSDPCRGITEPEHCADILFHDMYKSDTRFIN